MAKFIFHMNHILELKYKLEEQEKILYSEARRKLTEEEEKLSNYEKQKLGYENQYRELLNARLDVVLIRNIQAAVNTMKKKIKNQELAVMNANKSLEVARVRLNKAMIERKTYETLKEKAFEQFKKEVEHAEQKEIDELVSYKFNCHTS